MPYVTVVFDPMKVSQEVVDNLKTHLQPFVAEVLSAEATRIDTSDTAIDLTTKPEEIMVTQHATHPTDVNVPPLEIYIQAGRPKGRSGDKIVELLGKILAQSMLIPSQFCGEGLAGIFVTFHEHNGFMFIPKLN